MLRQTKHDRTNWLPSSIDAAARLVGWLNSQENALEGTERERQQVREVIAVMQRLYALEPQWKERERFPAPRMKRSEVRGLQSQLNGLLAKHKGVRQIVDLGQDELISRWFPPRGRHLFQFIFMNVALDLADAKLLHRVRTCGCGNYFVARSTITRFCSPECRIRFWEGSEERKEQKRRKAREYYLLHKAGIVKSSQKRAVSK